MPFAYELPEFLGTGGAFDFLQGNSSFILPFGEKHILLDCGHSVYPELRKRNLVEKIDAVMLTHLHDDHCGSLSTLIFHYNLIAPKKKLPLLLPEKFIPEVRNFLSFSMKNPENFVEFHSIEQEETRIFPIDTFGKHVPEMQTFGYYFQAKPMSFVYSGDLGDIDFLIQILEKNAWKPDIIFCDISFFEVPPHTYYKDAEKYLSEYRIIGYHHDPAFKPTDCLIALISEFKSPMDFLR